MRKIHVRAGEYDVRIGPGLLDRAGELLAASGRRGMVFVAADDTAHGLYGARLEASLSGAGFAVARYVFPHGERNKNLSTLSDMLEAMARAGVSRSDFVVTLGGGVTGDMAGFAAAVYMRGVDFAQIPTTLLSAVDASVGGKTAVDLSAGKNLAGAFHQPFAVLCDTDILAALPEGLLSEGAAEMIKCGALDDPALFEAMRSGAWRDDLEGCVAACVALKARLVDEDEKDTGVRQFLNLGHTFGHAAEVCSGFSISHGQGVAMGLVMAFRAAGLDDSDIVSAVEACGLESRCPYSWRELALAALRDKKRRGGSITLALPRRVGECELRKVPVSELEDYFRRAQGESL